VDVFAANDARPCLKEHDCNAARRRKKVIGYVGFMAAEVLEQKLKPGKSEVRQPVLLRANTLDQRYLRTIGKKLWLEFWKIQFLS
jgi:hypothetical protein